MSKIELRLSNIDPPLPDPPRTIYRDIVNLPDPVKLGITIRYFNHDDVGLYFQITGSGTGYTFGTVNLGLLASGADAYKNLDEFASRAKPSPSDLPNGEKEENITLILKAYTDSGYTNLKWTFERVVTVHWINSADPAFTVEVLNNFDDGTSQGWSGYCYCPTVGGCPGTFAVVTDYVLSPPYSIRYTGLQGYSETVGFEKSLTTPNKDKIFAIIDVRVAAPSYACKLRVYADSTLLVGLGCLTVDDGCVPAPAADCIPKNKWTRIVVPLPKNTTLTIKIYFTGRTVSGQSIQAWMDDFKLISK
jgi:hypothetical protein